MQGAARQHMVVGVTVSNMRSTPGEMMTVSYKIDDDQLSQALFYESVYMVVRKPNVGLLLLLGVVVLCERPISRRNETPGKLRHTHTHTRMQEGTESDGWVMTEAPMQPNLANGEWVPYRSYMNKSHLVPVASFPTYNLVVVNNVRAFRTFFALPETCPSLFADTTRLCAGC
jgi:hypothetical protein